MSLSPRGFGYDAARIMFVKGFCCEGVGQKAENLKQPSLGVCKAVLYDASGPGKPFRLLSSLPLLSTALLLGFSACSVSSSSANLGCLPPELLFAEADLAEAGCEEVPVHLSRCCRGSLSEARICVELFCMQGAFPR